MASISETSGMANLLPQNIGSSATATSSSTVNSQESPKSEMPEFYWMVKPCFIYKEEYKDCKSFKARFHQYFVHGKTSECQQWKEDYDNCSNWEDNDNKDALSKVIESERIRVRNRLRDHYSNDVWENRTEPPSDWNKELPDFIKKEYEKSILKKKADELKSGEERLGDIAGSQAGEGGPIRDEESSCSIV